MDYEAYVKRAYEMGAVTAKVFAIGEIVFDPRTILKCKYGCEDYGKLHNCPSDPKSLDIEQSIRIFQCYKGGILIHCHNKKDGQDISFEIERRAFLDGHHFALSLSDCAICPECKGKKTEACSSPSRARPALHSVGIDLFKTAKNLGMPLYPLQTKTDVENWYSGVFID